MKKQGTAKRILTFDLLRGYFLTVILFNHLQYYPSGLDLLTGRGQLYASTAEGFFVVSGIVLGIVRGRKLLTQKFSVAAKQLLKRAAQIYATSIVLTFIFTIVGWLLIENTGLKPGVYTDWANPLNLVWQTITLQYTYGWADFLRYYALFLAAAPIAVWLLRKGVWYVIPIISVAVWALFPLSPFPSTLSQPISWQLLFFSGLTIGYYWPEIAALYRSLSARLRRTMIVGLLSTFIVTLAGSFLLVFGHYVSGDLGQWLTTMHASIEQLFDKDRLPIARILLGTVWFWSLFIVFRRFEHIVIRYLGWLFMTFGTQSLYVYTIQAFVVFFLHLSVLPAGGASNVIYNLLLSIGALLIVWLAAKTRFLSKIIPN